MGTEEQTISGDGVATASDSLTITDNRTGRTYEVPIEDGTIRALALGAAHAIARDGDWPACLTPGQTVTVQFGGQLVDLPGGSGGYRVAYVDCRPIP